MLCPGGVGLLLRTVREAAGRSREQQAAYLSELGGRPVDPENLKRWETEKRLPVPYWHALLSQGLGIPVSEIQKAIAESRRHRRASDTAAILLDQEDDDMHRRTAVFGTAAIAAGIASDPWGRLAAAVSRPHVTAEEAHTLVEATDALFTTEEHLPARLLARRLAGHLETLTALIPGAGPHEKALTVAAAETAALAGWAAFDQGRHHDAVHYYRTAALAGREAGHPPVIALAMGYASYSAAPDKAREMLESAQAHVKGRGYAAARSWLAARAAEEAAGIGDRDGAVRALDRATTAFDYAESGELAWMSFYRQARLDSFALSTYAKVRHAELAEVAEAALEHLGDDDTKVRIAVLHDVATGFLVAGEIAQGVEVGRRFLDAATATPTTMGRQRMGQLAAVLPSGMAAAQHLAEDLRAALAT